MTTLQAARTIADAVIVAARKHLRRRDSMRDAPTQAVLDTLRANGLWLMAVEKDDDGGLTVKRVKRAGGKRR